jgi:uncharacterized C2H2 Zn-finger protein
MGLGRHLRYGACQRKLAAVEERSSRLDAFAYRCTRCPTAFLAKRSFERHLRRVHRVPDAEVEAARGLMTSAMHQAREAASLHQAREAASLHQAAPYEATTTAQQEDEAREDEALARRMSALRSALETYTDTYDLFPDTLFDSVI